MKLIRERPDYSELGRKEGTGLFKKIYQPSLGTLNEAEVFDNS